MATSAFLPSTPPTPADALLRDARRAGAAMLAVAAVLPVRAGGPILCPLRRVTGIPCPFCGMTHGVVATVHGHLATAFGHNPAAPLLVLAVVALWVLRLSPKPVRLPPALSSPRLLLPALAVLELVQLHHFGFLG